jgi:hypothetical protein
MSVCQGRTLEANWIVAAFEDARVKMGRNRNAFQSRIAPYASRTRLHMGSCGLVYQGCPFHPGQDDIL